MADIHRDYTDRNRTERERVYAVNTGNNAGWWIGGILLLAVLIIGFIALSGGEPAPVNTTPDEAATTTAPAADPAPATETAPATDTAPMTETAPADDAAPAAGEAPAEPAAAAPAEETAPAATTPVPAE